MPKRSFTVNRRTWLHGGTRVITAENRKQYGDIRGADDPDSMLYDPHSKLLCCLGFVARQCGVPLSQLAGAGMPSDLLRVTDAQHAALGMLLGGDDGWDDSLLSKDAQKANDSCDISNTRREQRLTALFKKHGYQIRFTGTYPSGPVLVKERPKRE